MSESTNRKAQRQRALANRMGVPEPLYQQVIQAAVNFSNGRVPDVGVRPWRIWGARNIGGRVRMLAQHPSNPNVIYVGTAQGGVFKTTDGGETWQPLGGPQHSFPVGALAIAPSDPNIIYVGTGESGIMHSTPNGPNLDAFEMIAAGLGFFRYNESTQSYGAAEVGPGLPPPPPPLPPGAANCYTKIVVDPHERDRCWIASNTGVWKREGAPVAVFTRETVPPPPAALPNFPSPGAHASDLVLTENWDPQNHPDTYRLLVALGSVGIFRGIYDPANPAVAIAWEATNGLPAANSVAAQTFDRICLSVCEGFPDHVYAILENNTNNAVLDVYHSTDGGQNWVRCVGVLPLANLGQQSWYDLAIAVHPDNHDLVVIGATELAMTSDAGANWTQITDQSVFKEEPAQHPDYHFLLFDSAQRNALWTANDGGISFAPDIVNVNPLGSLTWRKRSNGLCIAQFNDVTSSPTYPFMLGGGLQDNSAYVGYGGPTWYLLDAGDGGHFGFEIRNPRLYMAPDQNNQWIAQVVASNFVLPAAAGPQRVNHSVVLSDQPAAPNDDYAIFMSASGETTSGVAGTQEFIAVLTKHRVTPGHVLLGRVADVVFTANFGTAYTLGAIGGLGAAAALGAAEEVRAVNYGITGAAAAADWWAGTDNGNLLLGTGAAPPKSWANVAPPTVVAGTAFTSIAVHPNNNNYIAVATGGVTGGTNQGNVFLSNDRGAHWMDITGVAAAFDLSGAAPGAPLPAPLNSLPPCPISSLAFDPSVPAGSPQELYAGTLGGVYVIRNLPQLPAGPPPPIVVPAPFNPDWHPFNGTLVNGPLPLTLVNDIELVRLFARPGARATDPESRPRSRLYAALYGRGIYVCDVTRAPDLPVGVPVGGPRLRLFIRQHLIEDGLSYPRIAPAVLNTPPSAASDYNRAELDGDPRLPIGPAVGSNRFDDISAYDIRIDNEPFQFFEEVLDGVEFDTELRTKSVVPGQLNAIYVQVHTAGWDRADAVDVHLFFATAPPPAAGADPNPLPDLQADFWAHFTDEPVLAAPPAPIPPPAAFWQRIGPRKVIPANRLNPTAPVVMRFEWVPPASLSGGFVGLLAVCTSAADPIPVPPVGGPAPPPPPMPTVMRTLIRAERHVAFRLAPVVPYVPEVYIRDTVEDDGQPGAGGAAGRSPDIIVVQAAAADPATEFRDLFDSHAGDRIRTGVNQIIYVRVHNRRSVPVQAQVELLWAKPNAATAAADAHAPVFDGSRWRPIGPPVANLPVPAKGWAFAQFTWALADVPAADTTAGAFNAIAFIALVSSAEGAQDIKPVATRVRDAGSFWQFFNRLHDSNNAAFRAVLYGDPA